MRISVETVVRADIETVWSAWNDPESIRQWNAASDDWHTTASKNDLREGGTFSSRMAAKDGSAGFDFAGTYTRIVPKQLIEYVMDDGRKVSVQFVSESNGVRITEAFDADAEFSAEHQQQGWQSILDNFARFVEAG